MTTSSQGREKAALFMDAENHPDVHERALLRQLDRLDVEERHAYADWRNQRLGGLGERLQLAGFEMHHTSSGRYRGARKNSADEQMKRDILRLISEHPDITTVIIVSGDACFAAIARHLRQKGKRVVVAGDPLRTSGELRRAATRYLPIGRLVRWILGLDWLERAHQYLTFSFAVRELGGRPDDLKKLIDRGIVIQKDVLHPHLGTRREIWLDRGSPTVQAVLGCFKGGITRCAQM